MFIDMLNTFSLSKIVIIVLDLSYVRRYLITIILYRQIITELIDTEIDYIKKLDHVRKVSTISWYQFIIIIRLESFMLALFQE